MIYAGYTPGQQWPTDLGDNLAGGLNGCSGTDFHSMFQVFNSFWEARGGVRTPFSMNASRFRDFYKLSSIRQVGENLKQSLKIKQKPTSKTSVRLKPTGSQGLGWSPGRDLGESSRTDFSTNVSGFQLLLGTWRGCSDAIFNECFTF